MVAIWHSLRLNRNILPPVNKLYCSQLLTFSSCVLHSSLNTPTYTNRRMEEKKRIMRETRRHGNREKERVKERERERERQ